jgi:EF hand
VVLIKEVEMRNHVLVLVTTAAIFACGAIAANAQAPGAQTPGTQLGPNTQQIPGMHQQDQTIRDRLRERLQERDQSSEDEDSDPPGCYHYQGAMMGMMGRGMMGRGLMMRLIFNLMDADSDGTVSLQEFQAASERIFKAMDTDKDGTVTLEEMQDFMRGVSRPASHQ